MKLRFIPFVFLATVAAIDPDAASGCNDCGGGKPHVPITYGQYKISVLAVSLADDDGSNPSYVSESDFLVYLNAATDTYKRSGVDADFVLDPRSNFSTKVRNSLLNHDCLAKTTSPASFTKQDVNSDGKVDSKDANTICDKQIVSDARNAYALQYPASIVVFIRWGEKEARWDADLGHWTIFDRQANWGFSGREGHLVVLTPDKRGDTFLAHEVGHYLHLAHTHATRPTTLNEAETTLGNYIAANADSGGFDIARDGLNAFDHDRNDGILDTPADPGPSLFKAVNGDACDPTKKTVELEASFDGQTYRFVARPDRTNVMSYFKNCTDSPYHFSTDQQQRIHSTLLDHRKRLLHPELESCYEQHGLQGVTGTYAQQLEKRAAIIELCLSTLATATRESTYVDAYFDAIADDECPEF